MQLDDKICYCFHVTKRKVLNFLRVRQPRVPSQLSECGSAGTGCGWCVPFLKRHFADWQAGRTSESDDISPDDYARQRGAYIKAGKGTPPPGATPPPAD
ncbi:MAG TPA: (2Fe-2S)-binding protein [Planctomycetaceae bacterium]|nr:(2Fe-2S)-binding protein [Planctomycetaceae bacterium]